MRPAILAAATLAAAFNFGDLSEAKAQLYFGNGRVGVGIGIGGMYGGYGYRGYGYGYPYGYGGYPGFGYPGYGSGFYGGVQVVPRTYNNYGYSTPQRTVVANPMPTPPREGAGLPIKIVSPEDAGAPIAYSLNEYDYTIQPGESQTLVNDRQWTITFDRGGNFGTAEYSLSPGTYEFTLTAKGWEVYHDSDMSKLAPKGAGGNVNPPPSTDKTQ
jgi:hypothetical protein